MTYTKTLEVIKFIIIIVLISIIQGPKNTSSRLLVDSWTRWNSDNSNDDNKNNNINDNDNVNYNNNDNNDNNKNNKK